MAIEFGSRKETFENYKVYETMLAGRPFKVEMGKMCGLSNASALIRYGETCVMCIEMALTNGMITLLAAAAVSVSATWSATEI